MGSNKKRKKKDEIYLKAPGKVGKTNDDIDNDSIEDICPIKFEVKIKESPLAKSKVKVLLISNGERYDIMVGSNQVGVLDLRHSKIVTRCSALNVKYMGIIVERKNIRYAEFYRTGK
ncbi:MAG TPA: hypothetical protein VG738_05035 [Chitinophagaceae bacterium]|nr:hypothetical protein [Chitinophagaceae bacterium]